MAQQRLTQIQNQLTGDVVHHEIVTPFTILPVGARYLFLDNTKKRNALSKAVLLNLRDQLHSLNRSPVDGRVRFLPPFEPAILSKLEKAMKGTDADAEKEYGWLIDSQKWNQHRAGLPRVIFLRSDGPVFCSGHDLNEIQEMNYEAVTELFALCAEVMSLIRRSPAPVIGVVQGLATAAGAQLALTTDLCLSHAETQFRLPGSVMGLPCISPSTAVSRKVGNVFGYEMLALSESHRADELPGKPVRMIDKNVSLDDAVIDLARFYTEKTAGQAQALGKWAYWTQVGLDGTNSTADGYEAAVDWTGKVMALLAQTEIAKEGIKAFLEKRQPYWHS